MKNIVDCQQAVADSAPRVERFDVHSEKVRNGHLQALLTADPERGRRTTSEEPGIYLDCAKNRIAGQASCVLRGEKMNTTEKRAVLHLALRMARETSVYLSMQRRRTACTRCGMPISWTLTRQRRHR